MVVAPRYHRSLGLQSVFIVSPPLRYVGLFANNKTGISISLNQSCEGGGSRPLHLLLQLCRIERLFAIVLVGFAHIQAFACR